MLPSYTNFKTYINKLHLLFMIFYILFIQIFMFSLSRKNPSIVYTEIKFYLIKYKLTITNFTYQFLLLFIINPITPRNGFKSLCFHCSSPRNSSIVYTGLSCRTHLSFFLENVLSQTLKSIWQHIFQFVPNILGNLF